MRLMRSSLESTIVSTLLVCTICFVVVYCSENENQPPVQSPNNFQEVGRPFWSSIHDSALKGYYDAYKPEEIWKRAPSASFYGMRGKKVPGSNFFGMRGKKGPSGFLGMRGKKMEANKAALMGDLDGMDTFMGEQWPVRGSQEFGSEDERVSNLPQRFVEPGDLLKRAPAEGFMGLRGKRSVANLMRGISSTSRLTH